MLKEFKEFAMRGNVLDLAIAVVIGGAFGKVIASLVNDIVTPILGMIIGGVNFSGLKIVVGHKGPDEVAIMYGQFIQATLDFIIITFAIFIFVKFINSWKKKDNAVKESKAPSAEECLLTEIRDILKDNNKN